MVAVELVRNRLGIAARRAGSKNLCGASLVNPRKLSPRRFLPRIRRSDISLFKVIDQTLELFVPIPEVADSSDPVEFPTHSFENGLSLEVLLEFVLSVPTFAITFNGEFFVSI